MLTLDTIRSAPKALLHDHLDGGLRPATIIDLAREYGYRDLPTEDVDDLAAWFRRGADRKSLELYLETFAHTVGVMQHPGAIARVAMECAEDLAADGVVYAEVRFAPELSTARGLTPDEVVIAVLEGFRGGMERAARAGRPIVVRALLTAMRQAAHSHGDRGAGRRATARMASSASTSPDPRPATGPPGTSTRSSTSAGRTSTSRSTPANRSGCRPSGRRCRSAGPSAWATGSGSSTTSPSSPTAPPTSAAWPRSSATPASRSSCAPRPTSTPGARPRSRSIPSSSCAGCASG